MEDNQNVGKNFVEYTKYHHLSPTPQELGEPFPEYIQAANPTWELIDLPKPTEFRFEGKYIRDIIEQRRSVRKYSNQYLTMNELSYLLWTTQGIIRISEKSKLSLRTVPSAGARHPFETYLNINRVSGLIQGLYHFLPKDHKLELMRKGENVCDELTLSTFNQQQVATSAITFIWVAVPYRTSWRYGSRAYRYLYLDAGHVCQNLHLAAESISCGVCAIGAYSDDLVNKLVGVDGEKEFAIYLASLGKKTFME